jgi:N-acetylmuramic acid 6-phosphate (MurNAc-6-P) etherase
VKASFVKLHDPVCPNLAGSTTCTCSGFVGAVSDFLDASLNEGRRVIYVGASRPRQRLFCAAYTTSTHGTPLGVVAETIARGMGGVKEGVFVKLAL